MLTQYSTLRQLHLIGAVDAKRRWFSVNQTIVKEGVSGQCLYLIESGQVRVVTRVELSNHRHIQPGLHDLGPGDVFGELSLFDGGPHGYSVLALADTELLEFDVESLLDYLDTHPEEGYVLLQQLFRLLSLRLSRSERRLKSIFAWALKVQGIDEHL